MPTPTPLLLLLLAIAGAVGTLTRYALVRLVALADLPSLLPQTSTLRPILEPLPIGTLLVNAIGSAAYGVLWALADERTILSPEQRLVISAGFLGAMTTFSAFSYETANLLRTDRYAAAAINIAANNAVTIIAVLATFYLTMRITNKT